jgi:hypothetical protein
VTALGSGKQDRFLIESLDIQEQTIHVEDDGGWSTRELHDFRLGRVASNVDGRLILSLDLR